MLVLVAACAALAAQTAPRAEWRTFEGTWSASGQRQVLPAATARPAGTFQLSGALSLTGGAGLSRGFRGEAIGFDNGAGVMVGHCVWTDERGDRVYSQLRSETVAPGRLVTGTVVGGTGRYAGLTGEFTFEWQYVVEGEGGAISGRATGLRGRVRGGARAMSAAAPASAWVPRALSVAVALVIWFVAPPEGLTRPGVAAVRDLRGGHLLGHRRRVPDLHGVRAGRRRDRHDRAADAGAGVRRVRERSTILLIVVAFLVARAVVKCGLGQRLGHLVVSLFGRSTLGLSYSIFLVDGLIAPAFPSNTARGGVIYPLVVGLAEAGGATPGNAARKRLGGYLMFSGMVSLSLSSALWFTAMAANPLGAEMARSFGVTMTFGSWLLAASVPTLAAMAADAVPAAADHEAGSDLDARGAGRRPQGARRAGPALARRAHRRRDLRRHGGALGARPASLGLDSTAIAFLGLGVLMVTGVLTMGDIAKEGDVLATFIWFAVLYTLSGQLNEMGFMGYLGHRLAGALGGLSPIPVFLVLVVAYVLLHYLFVSQTAHVLALFAVFLEVGIKLGVPAAPHGVHAAVREQLLLGHHAAGIEREPAVHGQRVPVPGRAVQARRHRHRAQPAGVPGDRHAVADAGGPMTTWLEDALRRVDMACACITSPAAAGLPWRRPCALLAQPIAPIADAGPARQAPAGHAGRSAKPAPSAVASRGQPAAVPRPCAADRPRLAASLPDGRRRDGPDLPAAGRRVAEPAAHGGLRRRVRRDCPARRRRRSGSVEDRGRTPWCPSTSAS